MRYFFRYFSNAVNARVLPLVVCAVSLGLPAKTARFPFDPSRGLVEVEGTLNGALVGRFGLDTGADLLYIDREFARRAGVLIPENEQGKIVRGIAGQSHVATKQIRSFAIGDERIYNVPIEIIDLQALAGIDGNPPDGLIGYEALRRFYVTIDYPNQEIDLFSFEPRYDPNSVISVLFDQVGHLIVVKCEVEGEEMKMFLDYCASHTILTPEALEKLGRRDTEGQSLKNITLGEIVASDIPFSVRKLDNLAGPLMAELDGILGYSFLRRYRVTIDYKRRQLLFHR